jgi:WD40 repeat protein
VARGIQLAEEGDLFTGLLWLARPLERGGLTPEGDRSLRTRFACHLRLTHGRPVLRDQFFHEGQVDLLQFSPDARRLLTSCRGTVRVWDLRSGDCLTTLPDSVWDKARFSSDGTRVLIVNGRGLWSWDVATSRVASFSLLNPAALAELIPGGVPESPWQALALTAAREWLRREADGASATLSPDSRQALVALGPRVQLFDLETRRLLRDWPKPPGYRDGSFSPDGSRILLNAHRPTIYKARPEPGANAAVELSTPGSVLSVSDDGRRVVLYAWGEEKRGETVQEALTVRETSSGKVLCSIPASEADAGNDYHGLADLSPDGHLLAVRGGGRYEPGRLHLWDVDRGRKLAERPVHQQRLTGVYFRPDGRQVATTDDRTVRLWDVPSLEPSAPGLTVAGPFNVRPGPYGVDLAGAFRFSPDGSMCATAADDGTVQVWDLAGRRPLGVRAQWNPTEVTRAIDYCAVLENVQLQPSKRSKKTEPNMAPPGLEKLPQGVRTAKPSVAVSPDKTRLLTIVAARHGSVDPNDPDAARLWDAATGAAVGRPLEHGAAILHAEFSPDSRLVVTANGDGTARLWDARSGLPVGEPFRHLRPEQVVWGIPHATFSPDSSLLVTSGGAFAQVWRIDSRERQGKPLVHGSFVNRAVFSPDGKRVATASSDFTARLWNPRTGEPAGPALAHRGPVYHVAFSPDNGIVLTENLIWEGWYSAQLRLWDVQTQQPLSPPPSSSGGRGVSRFSLRHARTGIRFWRVIWCVGAGRARSPARSRAITLPSWPTGPRPSVARTATASSASAM